MRQPKWQDIDDEQIWHQFLTSNAELKANFTQAFAWGVFHRQLGLQVFRRGCFKNSKKLSGGYTAVLEVGKYYKFLSITGGPLLDWQDKALCRSLSEDLRIIAKKEKVDYIRIRPAVEDSSQMRKILKELHFRPAPQSLSVELAGILDLSLSREELLKGMSKSIRYKIRKVDQDDQIKIRVSKASSDAEIFADIHLRHARQQNYVPFSKKKLLAQFEAFASRNQALLYIAERKGEVLASNMIFFYNLEASHHYGVSTPLGQQYPSAPSLHLKAIDEALARGFRIYNFWGIVGSDQTKHRYYGLSEFKRRFGVGEHQYVPAHDFVYRPAAYRLIYIYEKIRRRWRRL